jgi:hypothetical protein
LRLSRLHQREAFRKQTGACGGALAHVGRASMAQGRDASDVAIRDDFRVRTDEIFNRGVVGAAQDLGAKG